MNTVAWIFVVGSFALLAVGIVAQLLSKKLDSLLSALKKHERENREDGD